MDCKRLPYTRPEDALGAEQSSAVEPKTWRPVGAIPGEDVLWVAVLVSHEKRERVDAAIVGAREVKCLEADRLDGREPRTSRPDRQR